MSIDSIPVPPAASEPDDLPQPGGSVPKPSGGLLDILRPLASLKLTVSLFAASILLIMVGTLAQVDKNMWEVMALYFRTWVAYVDLQVFFPRSFFPSAPQVPGGFYFPGGWMIGGMLGLNLLAAHLLRFKVQAKGQRLATGVGVTLVGVLLTAFVILFGHNRNGVQGEPLIAWPMLWQILRWSSVGLWVVSLVLWLKTDATRRLEWWSYALSCVLLGVLAVYLVVTGSEARLGDSSLRIVWQLLQGGVAGAVLLAGSVLLFKKRGGIVVIHLGVALLMIGELLVSLTAVEEQMVIVEGETANFTRESNKVELAIIDPTPEDHDDVVVVPGSLLRSGKPLFEPGLPFDIELIEYFKNARLREVVEGEVNKATAGIGLRFVAEEIKGSSGAKMDAVDVAAAYVRLTPKDDPTKAAVYLLSQQFGDASLFGGVSEDLPERLMVQGRPLLVSLRQKRKYKPYSITLNDVQKDDYLGTNTPMDYSSYISLNDPSRNVADEKFRVWMNNPLRYAGETFYQQGYTKLESGELTTLAVVSNTGWMIPYVACMLALIGMVAHFLGTLRRFVNRRTKELDRQSDLVPAATWTSKTVWGPIVIAAGIISMFAGRAAKPSQEFEGMDLAAFGRLPVVYEGRAKPIDTFAKNALKVVSNKQQYEDATVLTQRGKPSKQPAVKWLLDVATQLDRADEHHVFYIPDLNVQNTLGLQPRKHFRYSLNEFRDKLTEFDSEYQKARAVNVETLSAGQRKLTEVAGRLYSFRKLVMAFRPLPFPELPTPEEREKDPEKAEQIVQQLAGLAMQVPQLNAELMKDEPPLVIPVENEGAESWLPYSVSMNSAFVETALQRGKPSRHLLEWNRILDAYREGNSGEFNRAVASYEALIASDPPKGVAPDKLSFETLFNKLQPFSLCAGLYVMAFVINACGWLGWFQPLRRTALWLIGFTFVLHTLALVARIYISGRPPVTNLYSSAVFIGWGFVLLCLILENVFRLSIANAVAAIGGCATLIVAHNLAGDGDTMKVLQAVLDTQFWLATHVVTVTMGYATTFLAGGLATAYIFGSLFSKKFSPEIRSALTRMTYGTLCFAILFSFIGTVLGGLWADDSWGRFWGWDPKENGALIIVLWNALILHARWGGMIKERGLAALAVLGNVATAWSWFGVNELGVGLHSYGFTEGALRNLGLYCFVQLLIFGLALIPLRFWRSRVETATAS
jgi:ABC-type transport system involved in cytochrome c biogenesis permease subunit